MKNNLFGDSLLDILNGARKKATKKGIKLYENAAIKAYCQNKLNKVEPSL